MRLGQRRMPSTMLEWSLAVLVAPVLSLALAGCLAGGDPSQQQSVGEVTVSPAPRCTLRPSVIGRLRHGRQVHQADPLGRDYEGWRAVGPESAAARYVVHRQLMTKAEKITGYTSEPETPKIDPDPATGAIKIKYNSTPGLSTPGRTSPSTMAR